jgi:hypothetical protein
MLNTTNKITIWQQNVNKSPSCQHDLLSNNQLIRSGTSIIALQESAVNFMNHSIASKDWFSIYPITYSLSPDKTRSLLLINASINPGSWEQIDIPSGDITAVIIRSTVSDLLLYNIYNDRNNDTSLNALTMAHNIVSVTPSVKRRHIIWLGDFNRHHPVWDNANDIVTILPPFISFSITCPATSSPLPHLVLTIYRLLHVLHLTNLFYKA